MVTANRAGKEALEKLLDKLMPDRLKRPAQLGKLMIDIPSGEVEDREPEPSLQGKDPAAVSLGRRGGLKGSKAKMTPERRSEIARKAAKTRWKK